MTLYFLANGNIRRLHLRGERGAALLEEPLLLLLGGLVRGRAPRHALERPARGVGLVSSESEQLVRPRPSRGAANFRAFKRIFSCKVWLRYSRERAPSSFVKIRRLHSPDVRGARAAACCVVVGARFGELFGKF